MIVNQNVAGTTQICKEVLDAGIPVLDIITKDLSVGMKTVGDKFEAAEIFLPQIMMSEKAMGNAMEVRIPELGKNKKEGKDVGLTITLLLKEIFTTLVTGLLPPFSEQTGSRSLTSELTSLMKTL